MRILLAGLSIVLLSACATVEPPAMPTATLAAAPLPLEETFEGTDVIGGALTVAYPTGWTRQGDADLLVLVNDEALLTVAEGEAIPAGALGLTLNTLVTGDAEPLALMQQFITDEPQLGDATATTIHARPAATARSVATEGTSMAYNFLIIMDVGDAAVLMIGTASPDQAEALEATMLAIAASLQYTRP